MEFSHQRREIDPEMNKADILYIQAITPRYFSFAIIDKKCIIIIVDLFCIAF